MRSHQLRHRMKFHRRKEATSSKTGAALHTANDALSLELVTTVWASFEPLSEKDKLSVQAVGSEMVARSRIRYRDDITHDMVAEHRGEFFELDGDPLPDAKSGLEYLTVKLKRMK